MKKTLLKSLLAAVCLLVAFGVSAQHYWFKDSKTGIYFETLSNFDTGKWEAWVSGAKSGEEPTVFEGELIIPDEVTYNGITYPVVGIIPVTEFQNQNITSLIVGKNVVQIGAQTFCDNKKLAKVKLPDGLKILGYEAFKGCKLLESIDLPNGLEIIEGYAFMGSGLKSIKIPSGLANSESAFAGCENLTDIIIPDGFKEIPDYFFSNCTSLKSIIIPETVTSIRNGAFYGTGLQSVTIPENVDYLGYDSFSRCEKLETVTLLTKSEPDGLIGESFDQCDNLKSIVVNDDNPAFKVVDGALLSKDGTRFIFYPSGLGREEYSIPEGVTSMIEPSTFTTRLDGDPFPIKKLHFPHSLSLIDPYALRGISGHVQASLLSEISVANPEPPVVEEYEYTVNIFADDVYANATLYVPVGSADAYKNATDWKLFAKIEEKDFSGVAGIETSGITVAAQGGNIVVSGAENAEVAVYGIDGRLVYKGYDSIIPVSSNGIYIVAVAGTTFKVIL